MVVIVDYGMGNLENVKRALEKIGVPAMISADTAAVAEAGGLVLPGVGAFGDAMANLRGAGWPQALEKAIASGLPLLGICLGMQLLFEESDEMGHHRGLGLLGGRVRRLSGPLKVPHVGWNQIKILRESPLLAGLPDGGHAYFVHSYYVEPADPDVVLATTDYGRDFPSVVGQGQIFGVQFHPEKSQALGLGLLRNFADLVEGKAQRCPGVEFRDIAPRGRGKS
ncbi:MAG: imidazole glycerol phosphate synthase subunit HisH [Chloroflexi bacterium]|nr:imidazole glycerol phosphate synthase subunit HisH [Chloroflexota bacterium]